jgi:hypothetical protein
MMVPLLFIRQLELLHELSGGFSWSTASAPGSWSAAAMSQTGNIVADVQQGTWKRTNGVWSDTGGSIHLRYACVETSSNTVQYTAKHSQL